MDCRNQRRKQLLVYIRRRFIVKIMAEEFGVNERTIQADLRFLEAFGQIKRTPSYNSLHRQNGIQLFTREADGVARKMKAIGCLRGEIQKHRKKGEKMNRIRARFNRTVLRVFCAISLTI